MKKEHVTILLLLAASVAVYCHSWKNQYQQQNRIFIHSSETNNMPTAGAFKDDNYVNMLDLGFTLNDVDVLAAECKAYFLEYYGIDFHNIPAREDGSILLPDNSALMFPEKMPETQDSRVLLDSANPARNNNPSKSYVDQDTGCALSILTADEKTYGGKNQGMPRAPNDLIIYGYANIFDPQKPIHKDYLVERIKFKPAWPIKMVPVANKQELPLIEAVFKVETEYVDQFGVIHQGMGISGFSQRFDSDGKFFQSKRTVYTFPN